MYFQYLESMSELIRQGIEAANKDLEEENQNKLIHEVHLTVNPFNCSIWDLRFFAKFLY